MIVDLVGVIENAQKRGDNLPSFTALTITMPLGSSVIVRLVVYNGDGSPYIPSDGDVFYLSVKPNSLQIEPVPGFKKTATASVPPQVQLFSIAPSDTKNLQPGRYVYDVWLVKGDGSREQLIRLSQFLINPAVTLP